MFNNFVTPPVEWKYQEQTLVGGTDHILRYRVRVNKTHFSVIKINFNSKWRALHAGYEIAEMCSNGDVDVIAQRMCILHTPLLFASYSFTTPDGIAKKFVDSVSELRPYEHGDNKYLINDELLEVAYATLPM